MAVCLLAGCGQPTWDGNVGYCCADHSAAAASQEICSLAGCGLPTWDGNPGFCSMAHRQLGGAVPLCQLPGCMEPTWNGQPGFCSGAHNQAWQYQQQILAGGDPHAAVAPAVGAVPAVSLCEQSGCHKPTWDGNPGFCSIAHRNSTCSLPACGKRTWDGNPGYCSVSHKDAAGPPKAGGGPPAHGGPPAQGGPLCALCGKYPPFAREPHGFCSKVCRDAGPGRGVVAGPRFVCKRLDSSDQNFKEIVGHFDNKWDKSRDPRSTRIREIWKVTGNSHHADFEAKCKAIGNVKVFGCGDSPGNVQRRFHGTRITCNFRGTCSDSDCGVCGIVKNGFSLLKLGSWSGNKGHYGGGLYFTSMSSTAKGYGLNSPKYSFQNNNWMDAKAGNAVLVCLVACGRVETVSGQISTPLNKHTHDSRKINKSTGADELVVFDEDQTLLRYVVLF